ncbi:PstS family phosphate ABC transporter substrate-binding protein [Chryseobacterium sp. MFBS3-17]|uniref:PstS family phosphate ABC transporter substrate-binding protein n=1 Tax=Chryseobacterium sp. MFBS3-17 TaxID=2886689 RepID=UPI001D0E63AC|nr:substrate-binding domain-containing protein [Chryseobacterium sp. MFBS3-17]MCC2589715.1 substrate-binding domain-containing protein [Chryseobacterium sp. MFBS3-17]
MNHNILVLIALFFLAGCQKKEKVKSGTYHQGNLTVLTDPSFLSVTEALADGYMISYPETSVKAEAMKEDLAFLELLKGNARAIVMSRELNEDEVAEYERMTHAEFLPAPFAADAVVFVVPKDSPREHISVQEIESALQSADKTLIFDGTNSSNLNFVAQKFGKKPSELQFSILNGNETIVKELAAFQDKIGVIGMNTISRPYSRRAEELREMVKILPVVDRGVSYLPAGENLTPDKYPFTRILYFLVNEQTFNIAGGLTRFASGQKGQMIVQKEGLQPYFLYPREVKMY